MKIIYVYETHMQESQFTQLFPYSLIFLKVGSWIGGIDSKAPFSNSIKQDDGSFYCMY
jgi:hypothetical protein